MEGQGTPLPPSLRELRPGDPTRVGSYRIEARIGEGGMGAVYLGSAADGRRVAVKVVRPELADDQAFLARFHDEARNAERVASFCTAQVLEHGQDLGLAYLVTEYIDGPSLLQHVSGSGPLSPGMLHGVAVGVAAALVAIHSAGLVHRDLKPSNVLLSISGPRVIDFGIARALDEASSHTRTGQLVGTPGYIAPEQVTGHTVTPAVDIFAWGCLVAYAANAQNPFGRGSFEMMVGRALHAEPELGALTEPLAGLVAKALAKDPEQRPTAQGLLLSLVGGASESAVNTTLGEAWSSPPPPARPMPLPGAGVGPGSTAAGDPLPGGSPPDGTFPGAVPGTQPGTLRPDEQIPAHPPTQVPGRSPAAPPQPPWHEPTMPGTRPAPTRHGGPARRSRRAVLLGGVLAAGVATAAVAGGGYYLMAGDGHDSGGSSAAPVAGTIPKTPMLVRIDTKAGWPDMDKCHGDIGSYTPGDAKPTTLLGGDTCDFLPQRSPDGRQIAFTRRITGVYQIDVMNADGSDPRQLVEVASNGRASWSPDGKQLAYVAKKDGVNQLYTVDVSNRQAKQITTDGSTKDDPAWSSTGELMFWSKRDGVEQIYTMDPAYPDRPWTKISKDDTRSVDPVWSPDGRRIAFSRGTYPNGQIWVMNADGSGAHALTKGDGHKMDPTWSREGHWVGYVRGTWSEPQVWAVREDGADDQKVTPAGYTIAHPNW
ncbi:protein kinase domain-containing protein [Actinomadura macrotermitis]|uniref:Protein TolB n=1 Tax=Actinomadura macrotermitis TaxID=2585200 RepID=A0A7K0C7F4_9ACTN|nr:protein kinase [Actinomadura macrotermitis]MQY09365.1 Protein TolB [Actinomadura macrotermitis]